MVLTHHEECAVHTDYWADCNCGALDDVEYAEPSA